MKNTTHPLNKVLLAILMLLPFFGPELRASTVMTATVSVYNVSCYNGANGGLIVHATGGVAPYQYSLEDTGIYSTGFQSGDTFRSLSAGAYVIRVADAAGTSVSITASISQPLPLYISDSVVNTTGGNNNGALFVFVSGGTPPYVYSWQGLPNTGSVISSLGIGYESVTVTDLQGCSGFLQAYVDTGSSLFSASASINGWPNGCYPDQTFQIYASASGGTGPYSFSLDGDQYQLSDDGQNSYYFNNVTGPVHTIRVRDASNAVLTLVDTFAGIASAPLQAYADVTNATGGNSNGSALIIASGGSPGYTYDFETSSVFTDLGPGTYGIFVMDTLGCFFPFTFSVNDTTLHTPLSASGSAILPVCTNADNFNTGQILVTATGGLFPYQMELDSSGYVPANLSSSQSLFWVFDPGIHTVYVKDGSGSTLSFQVDVPADNLGLRPAITNASGNMNNGAISLIMTPGVAPYSYYWSDGTTGASDSGLAVGTNVQVTVSDTLGCLAYGNFTIDSGTFAAAITAVIEPTACSSGGQFTITARGGTQPYYDQYGNQLTPSIIYNGLPSGTYTYLVIDALRDTITLQGTIAPAPAQLAAGYSSTASGPSGSNGSATAIVSGGSAPYTYQWSMSSLDTTFVNGLAPGNYSLTVTDSSGCSYELYNIIINDTTGESLSALAYAYAGSPCTNKGSIAVYASGGTSPYIYRVGSSTDTSASPNLVFGDLIPGIYPVMLRDAAGDTFTTSVTLAPSAPDPALTVTGAVTNATGGMTNGSILAQVSGGTQPFTFSWQNNSTYMSINSNSQDLTGQAAGSYQVQVTDSLGCSQAVNFIIDSGNSVFAATVQVNNTICHGQASILITASGGTQPYQFNINGGAYQSSNQFYVNTNEFQNLSAGIYTVNVKDADGNVLTSQDTVAAQSDQIVVTGTVANATASDISNGSITLHVSGGMGYYGYYWTNDNTDSAGDTGLSAGVYAPYVYDSMGCEVNPAFIVNVGRTALSAAISVTNISCYGDSAGVITISGNSANQPILYALGDTDRYSPDNVFSGLAAGSYTVYMRDAIGMVLATQKLVRQPAAPLNVTGTITNANSGMDNGTITLAISGGTSPYTSLWSDIPAQATVRSSLAAGPYDADIIDAAGCQVFKVFTVDTGVGARISAISNVACYGDSTGSIQVSAYGGSPAYAYRIGNGSYQADSIFSGLTAGTYTITVMAAGNDSTVIQQTITQASAINIQGTVTNADRTLNNADITLNVSGGTQPYSFNWGDSITTENRTDIGPGSYSVILTDSAGCQASASFVIQSTGINGLSARVPTLNLYPNPASTYVDLRFTLTADQLIPVRITDALGQVLFSEPSEATAGENKITVNTATWAPGLYAVAIGSGSVLSAKLMIAR